MQQLKMNALWYGALAALALTACGGSQTTSTTTATKAASTAPAKTAANGAAIFSTNCSSCHGSNGKGVPGAFPPLAGNPVVTGNPVKPIMFVKDGLNGSVQIEGQTYNGSMPSWKGRLSNDQIAAVITYIRSSWGNKASAVTAAQVASTP